MAPYGLYDFRQGFYLETKELTEEEFQQKRREVLPEEGRPIQRLWLPLPFAPDPLPAGLPYQRSLCVPLPPTSNNISAWAGRNSSAGCSIFPDRDDASSADSGPSPVTNCVSVDG